MKQKIQRWVTMFFLGGFMPSAFADWLEFSCNSTSATNQTVHCEGSQIGTTGVVTPLGNHANIFVNQYVLLNPLPLNDTATRVCPAYQHITVTSKDGGFKISAFVNNVASIKESDKIPVPYLGAYINKGDKYSLDWELLNCKDPIIFRIEKN